MRLTRAATGLAVIAALILTPLYLPVGVSETALAQTADPPGRVGRLNYMSGQVSFAPGGVNEWAAAVLNYPLTTGAALWADEGARAEFHVDAHTVRIGELTEVDLLLLDDQTIQLRVPQGTIDVSVRELVAGERFEVATPPAAILLARAGRYRLDVDPEGQPVRVTVWSGRADVTTSRGVFGVRAGQSVLIRDDTYEVVRSAGLDAFGQWCLAREHREAAALQAASPYLPFTVTGLEDLAPHGTWQAVQNYGHVWYPRVRSGWTPYRHGRWMYVAPWGWTWVDSAPWGFAPFHYGRWAFIRGRWGWVPGVFRSRPVFAPALVAFVILGGGRIGWFPLAPYEVYVPPYRTSPKYYRRINMTIANVKVVDITRVNHVHRRSSRAVTFIRQENFRGAARVDQSLLEVPRRAFTDATVSAAAPVEASFPSVLGRSAQSGTVMKPPAVVQDRPVVVRGTPPKPVAPPALDRRIPIRVAPVTPVGVQPRPTQPGAQPKPIEQTIAPTPPARDRAVRTPPPQTGGSTPAPRGEQTPPAPRETPRGDQSSPAQRATPQIDQPAPTSRATMPPQDAVPTPRPRPTPRGDQLQPAPPSPQPRPTEREIVAPTPRPAERVVPTPRPQPTPRGDQLQPSQPTPKPSDRQTDGPASRPQIRGGAGNARPTPNCDPRSRDYDPARCPRPTPARTKAR